MTPNRANLDDLGRNSTYAILTVILIILSIAGVVLFFQLQKSQSTSKSDTEIPVSVLSPTPTQNITPTVTNPVLVTATPTPATLTYTSVTDKFTATYTSSRKFYQDLEASGTRYTFYSPPGNIAVHAGTKWSWTYPDRQFSQSLLVSGYPTFIYETDTQTIIDFKVGEELFTIQCVHGGDAAQKTECQQFLKDFKTN